MGYKWIIYDKWIIWYMDYKSHRIHGAAIYGNMDPINIPPLC